MTSSTISGNQAGAGAVSSGTGGNGGGIYCLGTCNLTNATISNNSSGGAHSPGFGAGIYYSGPSASSITNSTIDGNHTGSGGFAISGGIYAGAPLTITASTISNNVADGGGGGLSFASGGGKVFNSTISGNTGNTGGSGIAVGSTVPLLLVNSTVTGNNGSEGVFAWSLAPTVRNTIIAGNEPTSSDVTGTFVSQGHNLIGNPTNSSGFTNGVNGDQVGTGAAHLNPQLGPLANNGGPTKTHALLLSSTALDAGDDCVTQPAHCGDANTPQLATDQRGAPRPVDGDLNGTATTDIGAFEAQNFIVTNTSDSGAGSLRQAVTDANAASGTPSIWTNIPAGDPGCSGGSCTITLTTGELVISHAMSVQGPGANLLTISGNNNSRIFNLQTGVTCTINNLTLSNGNAPGTPGGGAILNNGGTLSVLNSAIANNSASGSGGLYMVSGVTNISGCLFRNNTASGSVGGMAVRGGTATISNSTFSGNSSALLGGALLVDNGSATLTNVTITNNRGVAQGGGGIAQVTPGLVILRNTIVAGNFRGAAPDTTPSDVGVFVDPSSSFNLIGSGGAGGLTNGVNNNLVGVSNPGLAALASNGGATQTHALLVGSPALDAGDNTIAANAGLTTDQRGAGFARSVDGPDADSTATSDIGAFEAQVFVQDILDQSTNEDNQLQFTFSVGGSISSVTASSGNTALVPNTAGNLAVTGSSATRTLTIVPLANQFGTSTITVTVNGSGGESMTDTFVLTVNSVNDAPSFTKGADQTVLEDSGAQTVPTWATAISAGPANESAQNVTFNVTNNNNTLFSSQPAVNSAGTLMYTPAANANGSATVTVTAQDDGGTANGGVNTSPSQTFVINVTAVNDPPSFVKGPNQTVNEDASGQTVINWATSISAGPANESAQTVTFTVTNDNNPLFSIQPAVAANGSLTYTPAANANGSATVTVTANDSGGTLNGGSNSSAPQSFTITVNSVNDTPSFTKGQNQTVNEDAGAQTVTNWATAISAGPANESSQVLTFQVTGNTNSALFSAPPAISATGTLSYTPAANANGSATITINLKDDGGTANGGNDTSVSQTFTITVNAVNDPPSFTKGADQTVTNNAGAQTAANWATSISPGPTNESSQTVSFQVTGNSNAGLFSVAPAVSSTGTLTYTPATNAAGTATITLNLRDNGGTVNGGVDTSASQTFNITVNAAGGSINFNPATVNTTESSGLTTVTVKRTGDLSREVTVDYATSGDNGLPCSVANGVATPKCDFTTALGTLSFAANEDTKVINIQLSQDSFVEGPETFTVSLSNATGFAAIGTAGTATVTIADDASEPATNAIDDDSNFVRQHYHDFLNREPDQPGFVFWIGQMSNCGSPDLTVCRVNVSGAFFLSIEFEQTGYLVERMYKTAYGDATGISTIGGAHQIFVPVVRFNEFLKDTQRVGQGIIVGQNGWQQALENNKQAYTGEFVASSRFISAFPTTLTPAQFVDKLNTNAGGVLSQSERQTAINLFGNAADTTNASARAQALRQVAEDQDLFNAEFNRAFVQAQYFGYLRRNPNDAPDADYTGYDFWLGKLNQFNGDYIKAEMVKAFIAAAEYRQRFGAQ
ncbi:MAG TPA: choice-of-anchor Q domain-containing protein [Pyrinomonadaceae bacterium]|nr:choice-of-anchor Q domain-containing protein [Pyrinomonadaceae bacterium]